MKQKNIEQALLQLKKEIDEAIPKEAELKGKIKYQKHELKKDWGCDSIADAEQLIKAKRTNVEKLNQKIDKGIAELKKKYELTEDGHNSLF